ncbi:MAG: leucine-rich repeat domain-containing protein, partial [Acidobacteriota bacterium]|nr:leucine-rich repeat domain-containing protein [Acidobacteriota bacterium]
MINDGGAPGQRSGDGAYLPASGASKRTDDPGGEPPGTSPATDREALEALYEATDGANWVNSDNWLTDAPLGEWHGVEIDSQGRVIGLRMAEWVDTEDGGQRKVGNGLTGSIPPELGSLTHLRVLDLSENQLEGEIPSVMGSLSSLEYLNLDANALTGEIPPELAQLSRLERLQLQVNQLTGEIPPQLGGLPRLEILRLSVNRLTGPIPAQLGGLVRLKNLSFNDNELTGPIPADLGRLLQLEALSLNGNQLTGPIPAELGQLSQLWWLSLNGNQLTGPIPSDLLRLGQLAVFSYFDNLGLCAPGTTIFITWLQGMERYDGPYCNESDVAVLNALYRNTGGENWTNSDGWSGDGAVSEWYGVSADSLGRVTGLDLSENGLTGRLPRNLDRLTQLTELRIDGNALTGRLPLELARLPLQAFHYADTEFCVPVEQSFRVWLNAISSHEGSGRDCAPLTERDILVAIHEATDGPAWIESENWLTDAPLEEWQGVSVDVEGRVRVLWLGDNNLQGPIPPELGNLSSLRRIYLSSNRLTGTIPPELGNLANLTQLWLSNNDLTGPIPPELHSLANLEDLNLFDNRLSGPIPPELGGLVNLTDLSLGTNNLTGPIPPELGNLASLKQLFIGDNPLTGPIPPALGNLSNLERLSIRSTRVMGSIPPELGNLAGLEYMWLNGNELTGRIPPELGNLDNLGYLYLFRNNLTGSVPKELASLDNLNGLYLSDNNLSGPIPTELGNLSSVTHLVLDGNALSGQVPGALGNLSTLEELILSNNKLTGPVPPDFGGMSSLKRLALTNNSGMEGTLPLRLAELHRLEGLLAGGTDLCSPSNSRFQTWLNGVHKRRISPCFEEEPPMAYLTQAVQSREFPVPLVAGEKALLRVFPTAGAATSQAIPAVRARFYQNDLETHVENIPGKTAPIPTTVDEGNLATSVNTEIPATVIRPGLEMVIEVDPEGMLDPGLGVKRRIPEEGRLA